MELVLKLKYYSKEKNIDFCCNTFGLTFFEVAITIQQNYYLLIMPLDLSNCL
jgi:hypothetical protein